MKIVITIGTGNSGCGAIHDFLIDNTKYKSPFKGQEFRMIHDPDGILNLLTPMTITLVWEQVELDGHSVLQQLAQ